MTRALSLAVALAVIAPALAAQQPARDRWLGVDKLKHFLASAFVQSVSYSALRALDVEHGRAMAGASVATLTVGIGKEVRDRRAGSIFSRRDLVADVAGGVAAAAMLERTRR